MRLTRSARSASAGRRREQREPRLRGVVRAQDRVAHVAPDCEPSGRSTSRPALTAAGSSRTAGLAPVNGRSSSTHPSGRQPAQASRARSRCRPRRAARTRRPSTAPRTSRVASRRVGASWLASAPDTDEHRDHRAHGEREVGRRHRRAAGPRTSAAKHATHNRTIPTRDRRQRGDERHAPADDAREHKLAPPGVLLGPQRAHRREQPPHGGEDGERAADPPGGVATDRQQVARRTP